jgi:catechol 2,3-dioxygenase-like lactoylglutathione lyase family enzyme
MKIRSLGHVVLRVTNRDRAERFYGDLLGLLNAVSGKQ